MSDTASLLEKFPVQSVSQADKSEQNIHQQIVNFKPKWQDYVETKANAQLLEHLEAGVPAMKTKFILQGNFSLIQALLDGLACQEDKPVQWILTLLYDMLREDSSCYQIFEEALKMKLNLHQALVAVMQKRKGELYITDKASWLLSAVMGHVPRLFTDGQVTSFLQTLLAIAEKPGSDLAVGTLEAIVNLLKSDMFRSAVWAYPGVSEHIYGVQVKTAPSQLLYKCIFAIWMLSFDKGMVQEMQKNRVVAKLRDTLVSSRVEKVVRMCLTVLRNLLSQKPLCEEIVELNVLDAVQTLEFEKWRDAELYDEIREVAQLISSEVQLMGNFERYERDLASGKLTWGFTHTSKFWGENVMKFEQNDFRALHRLRELLLDDDTDTTTLAICCHDIGEFVALHPLGKKKVNQLFIKERVMQLMADPAEDKREVRREALLCCQKIMLNKWQDLDKAK